MLQAGFAEVDITPPLGTLKIGWIKRIVSEEILAPLFARVAIFRTGTEQIAFVQMDTLMIDWTEVSAIRFGVEFSYGIPGSNVMISATHNHAGPAIAAAGEVPKDAAYAASVVAKILAAFSTALDNMVDVEIGFTHVYEWQVAHNRRVVMRDGTARTHGTFNDPDSLYIEGPIDPEVAVLAVRNKKHKLLGVIVNFACHPTHHGGDGAIHPGYPGVLVSQLRENDCPTALFLNGPSGNLHTANPADAGKGMSAEEAGMQLAMDVLQALELMTYQELTYLAANAQSLELPYRQVTEQEIQGKIRGAQRFIDPAIYDRTIPALLEKVHKNRTCRVEIQALRIGRTVFVGVPAEYFVEFGLRIKENATPDHALVTSCANGHVGYIPTPQAFRRGGYETTFGPGSMLAPEAGDMIADAAVQIIQLSRRK